MKRFLVFITFCLSLFVCVDSNANELQQTAFACPGSRALKDLVLGQNKETLSYDSILSKKYQNILQVYEDYDLYFYEQEKLVLKVLFEVENVTTEDLRKASIFWNVSKKPFNLALFKTFEKFDLVNFELVNKRFAGIVKEVMSDFGYGAGSVDFLKSAEPYQNSYRGIIFGDYLALCFPSIEFEDFNASTRIFKYILNHEFEHIRNRDIETFSFLSTLGFVLGKSFGIDLNDLVSLHSKTVELRAYVLAAIKTKPYVALKYLNSINNFTDNAHPDGATLRKYLKELQKVMQGSGLVKPLPLWFCIKSLPYFN